MPDYQKISAEKIEELLQLEAKATPGPWSQDHRRRESDGYYRTEVFDSKSETIATLAWHAVPTDRGYTTDRGENAEFIAASRNSIKDILLELRDTREREAVVNQAYYGYGCSNCGDEARANCAFCPGCGSRLKWSER